MPYKNIAELLILNANRYPKKTAIIYKETQITYQDLNIKVNSIANGMLKLGIGQGDKVGLLFPNCNQIIEVYFAIQKIGAVAVPFNFRLIPSEIAYLINLSECRAIFFSEVFADKMNEIRNNLHAVEFFICSEANINYQHTLESLITIGGSAEPVLFQDEGALSRIQFTGGTTGVSKGVMRTHSADIAEIMGVMISSGIGANPNEVVLIQCPLEHHGGHSWFTSTLAAGATLVICDKFNAEKILELIQRERVSYILLLPPSTYLRLLDCPTFANYDLSSIKLVQSSAGCTSPDIIKRIYKGFPNCCLNYGWGQTESGLGTSLVLTETMDHFDNLVSIGKPMPFIELKIVDKTGNELGSGAIGECLTKGPAAMSGYYNQPQLTKETITIDGWIRTGDIMMRDANGYYYLISRKKDMIKSGGENIFAREVEAVICKHSDVVNCVVFGIPDQQLGEGVMAVVQLKGEAKMTLEELQEHCKLFISSYKKPRYADFVDRLPVNDAGKIQKQKLVEMYREKYATNK